MKHSAKLHNKFVECVLALPYMSSLELYKKEKYCNNSGKSVNSFWNRKHKKTWAHKICVLTGLLPGVLQNYCDLFSSPNWSLRQFSLLVTMSVFVSECDNEKGSG